MRVLNAIPAMQGKRQMVLLEDPLGISDKALLIPPAVTPLLMLCDGTRTIAHIQNDLSSEYGIETLREDLRKWLEHFDEAAFLDNDNFHARKARALAEYRESPARPMTLAGDVYPSTRPALKEMLDKCLGEAQVARSDRSMRGMISPHIDYARGSQVYADVMSRAAHAINDAELVIILGTDHFDDGNPITLTGQSYQTPYGIVPTSSESCDLLSEKVPDIDLFRGELRHRQEHSIELALVWVHHMRNGNPFEALPILCGGHDVFFQHPEQMERPWAARLIHALQEILIGRKCLVIAAADLAHVGRVFGGKAFPGNERSGLALADEQLLMSVKNGDAAGFMRTIFVEDDRFNVCGITPIYLLLRLLSPTTSEIVSYEICPADQDQTSWVSICGAVFE